MKIAGVVGLVIGAAVLFGTGFVVGSTQATSLTTTTTVIPADDDVFAVVGEEYDVTPKDVEDAADAVLDWTFNG